MDKRRPARRRRQGAGSCAAAVPDLFASEAVSFFPFQPRLGLPLPTLRMPDPNPVPEPTALVECRHLSFGYGERVILDDISLTVPRGKVTALMGASGGGKTTMLRLIGGQVKAHQGELLFDGQDVVKL